MTHVERILALLCGEPVGEACPRPLMDAWISPSSGGICGPLCPQCHGTSRIRTEPVGEVEEAVAKLRHDYDHMHLRDGWGCRECRTIFTDESLQYDRANRFAVPVCPRCDDPVSRGLRPLLLKATFDVWDAERERDEALARAERAEALSGMMVGEGRRREQERDRLAAALQEIKTTEGRVCQKFELCTHEACRSSYAAWAIADEALRKGKP